MNVRRFVAVSGAIILLMASGLGLVGLGAVVQAEQPRISVTEIAANLDASPDWVELFNDGSEVDLSGWTLSGMDLTFPAGTVIPQSGHLVVTTNAQALAGAYPGLLDVTIVEASGDLADSGELVELATDVGDVVDAVNFTNVAPWPTQPSSGLVTLSLLDEAGENSAPEAWGFSDINGTPGEFNGTFQTDAGFLPVALPSLVVINEIAYNTGGPLNMGGPNSWVELYNASGRTLDLSGWRLNGYDTTFPDGTVLGFGSYLIVTEGPDKFAEAYPDVDVPIIASGEGIQIGLLELVTETGQAIDAVNYSDSAPWPTSPSEGVFTLSLFSSFDDNSLPASWGVSFPNGGTPGNFNDTSAEDAVPANVVINEIAGGLEASPDWIELFNPTRNDIDVSGWTIEGAGWVIADGTTLESGEFLVGTRDVDDFLTVYPGTANVVQFPAGVRSGGELLELRSEAGALIDSVEFDNEAPWPTTPHAEGMLTLSLFDPLSENSLGENWGVSSSPNGDPGQHNSTTTEFVDVVEDSAANIIITEIAAELNDAPDWLELLNIGNAADLSGWTIDGVGLEFAEGVGLAAGERLVATESIDEFALAYPDFVGVIVEFDGGISRNGELLELRSASGEVVNSVEFDNISPWPSGPSAGFVTLSLFDLELSAVFNNAAPVGWGVSATPGGTPGVANDTEIDPIRIFNDIVINELHYNPADDGAEFVELFFAGVGQADISGWDLDGLITFPAGTTITGGEFLVVTSNLEDFQANHPGVAAIQWTDEEGGLSNGGELVRLDSATGFEVDSVEYEDGGEWTGDPDGDGPSLSLTSPGLDNSLAASWAASPVDGGTPGVANFEAMEDEEAEDEEEEEDATEEEDAAEEDEEDNASNDVGVFSLTGYGTTGTEQIEIRIEGSVFEVIVLGLEQGTQLINVPDGTTWGDIELFFSDGPRNSDAIFTSFTLDGETRTMVAGDVLASGQWTGSACSGLGDPIHSTVHCTGVVQFPEADPGDGDADDGTTGDDGPPANDGDDADGDDANNDDANDDGADDDDADDGQQSTDPAVFAITGYGTTGNELIQIRVNDFVFETIVLGTRTATQLTNLPTGTTWGDIELFFGDGVNSDAIFTSFSLDGETRTMVAGDVLASGQWTGDDCSELGDPLHSTVHCRGVVQFPDGDGDSGDDAPAGDDTPGRGDDQSDEVEFSVVARGTTGTELLQVRVNGFTQDTIELWRRVSTQSVTLPAGTTWGDIELYFGDGPNSDVVFTSFELDGETRMMTTGDVFASGQWTGSDCTTLGDPIHSTLHCRGVVQFPTARDLGGPDPAPVPVGGDTLAIEGRGTTGSELVQVRVNGFTVDTVTFSRSTSTRIAQLPAGTTFDEVELYFTDGPLMDIVLEGFELGGETRTMTQGDVLVSGQWTGDDCSELGDPIHSTVHCRGVVQFP